MESIKDLFDEQDVLFKISHNLPAQSALRDFVHHNTIHAVQYLKFYEALRQTSQMFGYKTYLSIAEFMNLFYQGKIHEHILDRVIREKKEKKVSLPGKKSFSGTIMKKRFPG
ncbi:putative inorganic carbon transporter subunit DabA [Fulvivirga ulvae]|uniref:putative inorganic carbon transporter subunit DabA n=1 Tax=Fulvivirga ulvae TaxID=2904245 RepID=UPI002102C7A8|nr:putative inorganic carbon transporter subunit DabA [Fulvivirga ulvae]